MNAVFARCLDTELQISALKKRTIHQHTPKEPEILFKKLVEIYIKWKQLKK